MIVAAPMPTARPPLYSADLSREISYRVNPFDAFRRDYDEMILECFRRVRLEEGNKKVQDVPSRGRIHFQPYHSGMLSKGEDDPIAEMPIKSYKNPLFIDSLAENLSVICPRLADFRGAYHIEPRGPQRPGYMDSKHLIEVQPVRFRRQPLLSPNGQGMIWHRKEQPGYLPSSARDNFPAEYPRIALLQSVPGLRTLEFESL